MGQRPNGWMAVLTAVLLLIAASRATMGAQADLSVDTDGFLARTLLQRPRQSSIQGRNRQSGVNVGPPGAQQATVNQSNTTNTAVIVQGRRLLTRDLQAASKVVQKSSNVAVGQTNVNQTNYTSSGNGKNVVVVKQSNGSAGRKLQARDLLATVRNKTVQKSSNVAINQGNVNQTNGTKSGNGVNTVRINQTNPPPGRRLLQVFHKVVPALFTGHAGSDDVADAGKSLATTKTAGAGDCKLLQDSKELLAKLARATWGTTAGIFGGEQDTLKS